MSLAVSCNSEHSPRCRIWVKWGVVAGTPAGLLDTQLANDLDIHDAAQIQRFPPPQV